MAIVTKSIGTSSRDYSTIALWEAAIPSNLVSAGDSWVGECYNDSEFLITTGITIAARTVDSTHNITLQTGPGQSFRDNASVQTNALKYNVANGVGIRNETGYSFWITLNPDYTTLSNLQFGTSAHLQASDGLISFKGSFCVIQNSILSSLGNTQGSMVSIADVANHHDGKILNCLVIDKQGGYTKSAISIGNSGNAVIANCTLVNPSDVTPAGKAIAGGGGHYAGFNKVINTAAFGFTTFCDDTSAFTTSSTNNCTDLTSTTVPNGAGSGNLLSKTFTSQFVGTTTSALDFRAKAAADILDAGATDTTDVPSATDIVGTSRPQGSAWDIGAWELVVASGVTGTLGTTEAKDVAALTGTVLISGTLAATESPDTLAFTGTVVNVGTLAATETQDLPAFTGNITSGVTGTLVVTESQDVAALTGSLNVFGTLTATEGQDIAALTGTVLISGTLVTTENSDIALINGSITSVNSGTLATTEAQDIVLFVSTPAVGGSWRWLEGYNALDKKHEAQTPFRSEDAAIKKAAAVLSSAGGHARAESLTPKQRTIIATKAAQARWK